jgi:DNA end-binding protein Ku
MKPRAIWKGVIRLDDLQVAVNLYSAVVDRAVHFHLLHDQDMVRLQQRLVNPQFGRTVTNETARKAAVVSPDSWVMLTDSELDALEPEPSRDISIIQFVAPKDLPHQWYDRPYYLGPDEDHDAYFAFAEALARQKRIGICRWAMRKKRYLGAIQESDGYLVLSTLRHAEEVIPVTDLEPPAGAKLNPKEQALAEQLIRALEDTFDPEQYRDEYQAGVRKLVAAKRKGETVEVEEYEERPKAGTLESSLKASLLALKK